MICRKEELRKKYKRIRDSIAPEKRRYESEQIFSAIKNSEKYKKALVVFSYVSFGSEVETWAFIRDALNEGKRVAVPFCLKEKGIMVAVEIRNIEELAQGAFGIFEPKERKNILKSDEIDVVIMPALAFDKRGVRLGYGGGYYDRYLKGCKGSKIGVAFLECMADELPCDEYDIKADAVVFAEEGTVKWQPNI